MDARTYQWIVALFRSTDGDVFEYLDRYTLVMDAWLQQHTFTTDQLQRYMLVGFWSLYRTANHLGGELSTVPERWNLDRHPWTRNQAMVATFNAVFGRPIKDTADYLALLGCTSRDRFAQMGDHHFMVRYVLNGHTEDADHTGRGSIVRDGIAASPLDH
jgi:hypothetical protein